jgi:hypothetical protein
LQDNKIKGRVERVRNYVKKHPGTTKTKIVDYMEEKGDSSRVATLKIINDLIFEEIIKVVRDRPKGRIPYLFINDNNEFNLIDKEISEIEALIDGMYEPMRKIFDYKSVQYGLKHEVDPGLGSHFEYPYREAVTMMLQLLLVRIDNKINSKDRAYSQYARIIKLMQKLTLQFYDFNKPTDFLRSMTRDLRILRQGVSHREYDGPKMKIVDTKTMSRLISKIESFQKTFLI